MPTEAGPGAEQGPGMRSGGDRRAGGGGDERHRGEDADGAAGTLPAEPFGWGTRGRQSALFFASGGPRPRHHLAHLQARRCPLGREVGAPRGGPRAGRPGSGGQP